MELTKKQKEDAKLLLFHSSFGITLNANDFFQYACADSLEIDAGDYEWIIPIVVKYGDPGIHAVMSYIADTMPIKEWQTERFKAALQEIKELNPEVESETRGNFLTD